MSQDQMQNTQTPSQTQGQTGASGPTGKPGMTFEDYSKGQGQQEQDSLRQAVRSRYPDLTDRDFDSAGGNLDQLVQAAKRDSADDEATIRQSIQRAVSDLPH